MAQKCPSKACVCASISIWVTASLIVFVTTAAVYLGPVWRNIRYSKRLCIIENTFYVTQYVCDCGKDCSSSYPCFMVQVTINDTGTEDRVIPLYIDDLQQTDVSQDHVREQEKCSLRVCEPDPEINRAKVRRFEQEIYLNNYVQCYYDAWFESSGAVLYLQRPGVNVIFAVLFPALAVFLGAVACCVFCKWCRAKENLNVPKFNKSHKSWKSEKKDLTPEHIALNSIEVKTSD